MKLLYAGDSPVGGSANYLLGILRALRVTVRHVPPTVQLRSSIATQRYDAIILSDFPRRRLPQASEAALARQVEDGTGLLMVGGWASFSGPMGGWRGSRIEQLLPVRCLTRDDRISFPSGAVIRGVRAHPMFDGLSWAHPPVICGLNRVGPAPGGRIVLAARPLAVGRGMERMEIARDAHPLLVVGGDGRRVAALTTDLAPHWCGGLVDWGRRRLRLSVTPRVHVEVGDRYMRFVSSLIRWLARRT